MTLAEHEPQPFHPQCRALTTDVCRDCCPERSDQCTWNTVEGYTVERSVRQEECHGEVIRYMWDKKRSMWGCVLKAGLRVVGTYPLLKRAWSLA